jgi:hypothetical protein
MCLGGEFWKTAEVVGRWRLTRAHPVPLAVSGEYGSAPTPSSFNAPSQSQSPQFYLPTGKRKQGASSTSSVLESTSGSISSPLLFPRGRFQSGGSSSYRRPRPVSYDEFSAKPRRSRFESMANLGAASGEQASASDLMTRDTTEGSVSRQTMVIRE